MIDGTDRARQAVRQNAFQNVDVIKVTADENLTVPELAAVVEEAHRQHLKVAVHAVDKTSIQTAIDAGADSIEHGNEVTDEQLKQMRDKGIFLDLTPTFYGGFLPEIRRAEHSDIARLPRCRRQFRCTRQTAIRSVGSASVEVGREIRRRI